MGRRETVAAPANESIPTQKYEFNPAYTSLRKGYDVRCASAAIPTMWQLGRPPGLLHGSPSTRGRSLETGLEAGLHVVGVAEAAGGWEAGQERSSEG